MRCNRFLYKLFAISILIGWLIPGRAQGQAEINLPAGFTSILSVPGIQLYQKNYANGSPDFVQRINLHQGAAVIPLFGTIMKPGTHQGVYGGDNPAFEKLSLPTFWKQLAKLEEQPVCITNGQFFFLSDNPTHLPFPLKKDGVIISDGYDDQNFPGQRLMLEIWPERVNITMLTREALYSSTAPHVIAGLSEDANKRSKQYAGRTFVGVQDQDNDGQSEILLIFNTLSARQVDAANVLRDFGASQVMMLDGGGSTQLICNGNWLVRSDRWIPQAIGVVTGAKAGSEVLPVEAPSTNRADDSSASVGVDVANSLPGADPFEQPTRSQEQLSVASALTNQDDPEPQPERLVEVHQVSSLKLEVEDILWVPSVILPIGLLVMLWVSRGHRQQEEA